MAITAVDVQLWRKLRDEHKIPLKPTILEIGEANWYGDYPLSGLAEDVRKCKDDRKYEVRVELATLIQRTDNLTLEESFLAAKYFYELMLNYSRIGTIDLNGTEGASKVDLNYPIHNSILFDVIINTGTLEHVFDIAQCFRTIHDNCAPSGLMYHVFPMRGWLDHGFYSINPTLLVDIAAANGYKVEACCLGTVGPKSKVIWLNNVMSDVHTLHRERKIPADTNIYIVWRKGNNQESFKVPMQGYYANTLTDGETAEWHNLR